MRVLAVLLLLLLLLTTTLLLPFIVIRTNGTDLDAHTHACTGKGNKKIRFQSINDNNDADADDEYEKFCANN